MRTVLEKPFSIQKCFGFDAFSVSHWLTKLVTVWQTFWLITQQHAQPLCKKIIKYLIFLNLNYSFPLAIVFENLRMIIVLLFRLTCFLSFFCLDLLSDWVTFLIFQFVVLYSSISNLWPVVRISIRLYFGLPDPVCFFLPDLIPACNSRHILYIYFFIF